MKLPHRRSTLAALLGVASSAVAQRGGADGQVRPGDPQDDVKLPNGKSQIDEILKVEREQNIKDAAKLADLADELKQAIEKEDRFVFSLNTVKMTEDIEKLARKIRTRMRHE